MPSEDLIRVFRGEYPNHSFDSSDYPDSSICDLSVGDGRNYVYLNRLGFRTVQGTEITRAMADLAVTKIAENGIDTKIHVGTNLSTPFNNGEFQFLVSWNSCYYVENVGDFPQHIAEFSRILGLGGYLILSIPMLSHRVLKDCQYLGGGYSVVRDDPSNTRNGAVWRTFRSADEIVEALSPTFSDFRIATISDDMFGWAYHHYIVVCKKA
jgi:SAM-dependent methyltransferase